MKIIFVQKSTGRKFWPSCRFSHGTAQHNIFHETDHLINDTLVLLLSTIVQCVACTAMAYYWDIVKLLDIAGTIVFLLCNNLNTLY